MKRFLIVNLVLLVGSATLLDAEVKKKAVKTKKEVKTATPNLKNQVPATITAAVQSAIKNSGMTPAQIAKNPTAINSVASTAAKQLSSGGAGLSAGAIAGIVVGVAAVLGISAVLVVKAFMKPNNNLDANLNTVREALVQYGEEGAAEALTLKSIEESHVPVQVSPQAEAKIEALQLTSTEESHVPVKVEAVPSTPRAEPKTAKVIEETTPAEEELTAELVEVEQSTKAPTIEELITMHENAQAQLKSAIDGVTNAINVYGKGSDQYKAATEKLAQADSNADKVAKEVSKYKIAAEKIAAEVDSDGNYAYSQDASAEYKVSGPTKNVIVGKANKTAAQPLEEQVPVVAEPVATAAVANNTTIGSALLQNQEGSGSGAGPTGTTDDEDNEYEGVSSLFT